MEKIKRILIMLAEAIYEKKRVVLALSCLVVFMTTYMLILPAFTLEADKATKQGGIDIGTKVSADRSNEIAIDASENTDAEPADINDGGSSEDTDTESASYGSDKTDSSETNSANTNTGETSDRTESDLIETDSLQTGSIAFEGDGFSVAIEDPSGTLPADTSVEASELVENPAEGTKAERKAAAEEYQKYYKLALKAVNDEATSDESKSFSSVRFYDITLQAGDETIQPEQPVSVTISYDEQQKDLQVDKKEDVRIIHFAENEETGEITTEILDDKNVDVTLSKSLMTDTTFEAESFSVYGVIVAPAGTTDLDGRSFTISRESRYATATIRDIGNGGNNTNGLGKTTNASQATEWQFEQVSGNTYRIFTTEGGQKRYLQFTGNNNTNYRANVGLTPDQSNASVFTVEQANSGYRISSQLNGTTYYLDEHNGNNGNGFAGWHGQTDNGILTLGFDQPVMQDNGQYMTLVKYDSKYYIVNNDCSLTEVKYDEATKTVEVEDPMLWTVEKNNPNGHIYFNSTEAGFNDLQIASDWYRRYMDPSSDTGYLEETNGSGRGHVDIDYGTQHYANGIRYWEHHITNRSSVLNTTGVSIDNTGTSGSDVYKIYHGDSNSGNYLGVVTDSDGNLRLAGQQAESSAAEFVFASPTGVKDVDWANHTVNHIDISIAGSAKVSVPLAYGRYYGSTAGDAEDPILVVTDSMKIELSEAQMVDPDQLRITAADMKRATITAARKDDGTPIDDAFYITGYSGNVANGTSNDQVRIEGSFLVADLRGTQYEHANTNSYPVNQERLRNIVEYTVSVVKPLTYNLIDPELGQLYDADGNPITITVDVAFSASFNYWDSGNECPAVHWATGFGGDAWTNGGVDPSNISGMDFVLGGDADNPDSPLVALEITKVIMDDQGNTIKLSEPVTNYFEIYEKRDATNDQKNGVQDLHVIDSLHHPEWQADPRDATIHDGYKYWRTKKVKVDDTGSAIVFDFDATDAMYYIVEKHDEESLPETVTDKDGKEWSYVKTYIETEYVRRGDKYDDKTTYPSPMHITEEYSRDSGSYASIPEVAGHFINLKGVSKKEGFLEFYVYNIYEPKKYPVKIKKVDTADPYADTGLAGAEFDLYGPYDGDRQPDTAEDGIGRKETKINTNPITTGSDGTVKIGDLEDGTYYLYETKAKDGYILMPSPVKIVVNSENEGTVNPVVAYFQDDSSIDSDGDKMGWEYVTKDDDGQDLEEPFYQLSITNSAGVSLPHSGGIGTTIFYILGSILVIGSGIYFISRRRIAK